MSDLTQTGELRAGIRRFQDGRYADFTIKCGAREWKAHKIILSAISHVLEKACFGGFKVSRVAAADKNQLANHSLPGEHTVRARSVGILGSRS